MKLKSSKGFSLIEILIVIAIIAILGVIAMPNYNKYRANTNLKEAIGALMADLNFAKQSAITENVNYTVTLSTSANTYTVTHTTAAGVTVNVTKSLSDFGSRTYIYSVTFPFNTVTFRPRGILAETGGPFTVLLRNKRDSCIHINVSIMGSVTKAIHQLL